MFISFTFINPISTFASENNPANSIPNKILYEVITNPEEELQKIRAKKSSSNGSEESVITLNGCGGNFSQKVEFTQSSKFSTELKNDVNNFTNAECSVGFLDTQFSSIKDSVCNLPSSAKNSATCISNTGDQSHQNSIELAAECSKLKAKIEKDWNSFNQALKTEQENCLNKANNLNSKSSCNDKIVLFSENIKKCNTYSSNIKTTSDKLLAFAKEHWLTLSSLFGAVGVGTYMLMDSGKKQKDQVTTNPEGTQHNNPNNAQSNNNSSNTENNESTTKTAESVFKDPSQLDMCRYSTKPLECFVTPDCDLKCVSQSYGVSNYGGFLNDTTRINSKNQVVDATNTGSQNSLGGTNNGSAPTGFSGGGSGSSGSGSPLSLINGNNETGVNGSGSTGSRPQAKYYDDDDDHSSRGGGGGGYAFSNSNENEIGRYPATAKSLKEASNKPQTPEESGPILSKEINLFSRIYEVSRLQCVRGLVYCDK